MEYTSLDKYKVFSVALPDIDRAQHIARQLEPFATHRIDHPSGRPWILTQQLTNESIIHLESPFPVVVIGSIDSTSDQLLRLVTRVGSIEKLNQISREIAGSFLVFGEDRGETYSNAPALQSKRLFHAVIDGVRVVGDRADLLADLGGFDINRTTLGLRMLRGLPHPADSLQVWDEVHDLPGWDYLMVSPNGIDYRKHRWWHRPLPELHREEAAERLRDALDRSVRARTSANHPITCDLSGGLDSTPICYFASNNSDNTYAHTYYTNDPGGREDLDWARRAVSTMPNLKEHQVFSNAEMPDFYEQLTTTVVPMDSPSAASGTVPRLVHMLRKSRNLGSLMHLNGLGGDHLLRGVKPWNHTIVRKNPLLGWKRARDEDIPDGISKLTTIRELSDRRTYAEWFHDTIANAFSERGPNEMPRTNDWSVPISSPSWMDAGFAKEVREVLDEIASTALPLDENRGGNFDIQTILHATALTRAMEQAGNYLGVAYEAPLLDDNVINAVLAAKHEERDTPIEWKPLMKEAMRGLLSDDYLRRTSKIGGAPQAVRGFAAHYKELTQLWEDSGLFEYGIIDADVMNKTIAPTATSMPLGHVSTQNNVSLFLAGINQ